jgi:hypothetical protein
MYEHVCPILPPRARWRQLELPALGYIPRKDRRLARISRRMKPPVDGQKCEILFQSDETDIWLQHVHSDWCERDRHDSHYVAEMKRDIATSLGARSVGIRPARRLCH